MATVVVDHPITRKRRPSRPPRSPSITRSTGSKRSPSPIISALSAENPKGVKNITRKVIKRLEGLGHLDMVDSDLSLPEEDEFDGRNDEKEVEQVLYVVGQQVKRTPPKKTYSVNGHGVHHGPKAKKSKTDFEIPRKLLHSSIGKIAPFLCRRTRTNLSPVPQVSSPYTFTFLRKT